MFKLFQQRPEAEALSQRITWGHWFSFFNIGIVLFIASRYAFNADWPNTLLGKLYFFISLFGHFSFIVFAVYLLLLFPLSFIIRNQLAFRVTSVIIATLGMVILLIDTEIFKTLYLHLSPLVWKIFIRPKELTSLIHWQMIIPILAILMAEIISSYWIWHKLRRFARQRWGKFVALFFICCFTATHLFYAWADITFYRPITAQKSNYPLSYPMTAKTFFEKHGLANHSVLEQQIKEHGRPEAFYLDYPKKILNADKIEEKTNVIIVNISNLSNKAISLEKMPNLVDIRLNSLNFTQHYIAGDSAMASIVNLFYGLTGQYVDSILNEQKSSPLIDILKQNQYKFGLFSAKGFKAPIYHRSLFNQLKLHTPHSNKQMIIQWKKWIENYHTAPFFNYLDLKVAKEQILDKQIAQIWSTLTEQKLLQNTVVIITSDLSKKTEMKNSFDKLRTQVPMIIYWKGQTETYEQLSSHLDILPTLLNNLFGVTNSTKDYSQGIDLINENNHKWLLSANSKWRVAIMPDGKQYQIQPSKGRFKYFDMTGKQQNNVDIPLNLFLQLTLDSNYFMEK
ncbi:DUF3413 domain-containing protein [Pasteurella atlantica]|uniref:DUF3413 domain-containing protein n=1 Tax=Pasteurellaceae TaxID=712 RepID=UPI00274D976F|nr:DUF3413 domain-containing protein [Pasteurella atlantica]MDP8099421.1 DUF3413 domain-containing protein [Pasteurella atlantica]MDP8107539.1 DUF3413 domain-containing protein [Pasteurella atlantica]MDP8117192.1 DUF3413 domain-containing protein [Pasteurella atlantica]